MSTYAVYHSIRADGQRQMNLDRLIWNGEHAEILGPSTCAAIPQAPSAEFRWGAAAESSWRSDDGAKIVPTGDWGNLGSRTGRLASSLLVAPATIALSFVGTSAAPYSVSLETPGSESVWHALFSPHENTVVVNGVSRELPPDFEHGSAHSLALELNGTGVVAHIDGALLLPGILDPTSAQIVLRGVRKIGYCAITNTTRTYADQEASRPIPGSFDGDGTPSQSFVVVSDGSFRGRAFLVGDFEIGSEASVRSGSNTRVAKIGDPHIVSLPIRIHEGAQELEFVTTGGTSAVRRAVIRRDTVAQPFLAEDQELIGTRKRALAHHYYSDLVLTANVWVDWATRDGHGDILLRSCEYALGYEGHDEQLGRDFFIGYSVQFWREELVIAKHRYDETPLASAGMDLSGEHQVKVTCIGSRISVVVDGFTRLEWKDPDPIPEGHIGLRAVEAHLRVMRVEVAPV